jgi:chemotaxis protein MotB
MALLMSFFVMVAAYSTQDQNKLKLVSGSMRDAFGTSTTARNAGIIERDGVPTRSHLHNARQAPPEDAADHTTPYDLRRPDPGESMQAFSRGLGLAAVSLRQALRDMPEIAELSKNIVIEHTRDGLDLSIVDQDGRAMFPDGDTQPYERTRRLIEHLAPTLRRLPNRIAVAGHTSALPDGAASSSAWRLTQGRALVVREILEAHGLSSDRFAAVSGRAATSPLFPEAPALSPNRRVTITLVHEAGPLSSPGIP